MLAIKECLIREGVLNLDNKNNSSPSIKKTPLLYPSKSSGNIYTQQQIQRGSNNYNCNNNNYNNMDMPPCYRKTVANAPGSDLVSNKPKAASSDLSTASATAKSSCQQQQQQTKEDSSESSSKRSYRGQHPHFYHHAAPAYYTDVNLRIHTPNASDVAALNENYQSVYSTPTQLVGGERFFPKSSTATVAPPPIGSGRPTAKSKSPTPLRTAGFFRGDSAALDSTRRRNYERCAKSSAASVSPTKGEQVESDIQPIIPSSEPVESVENASLVYASTNFKPTTSSSNNNSNSNDISNYVEPNSNSSGRSSRHTQRFSNRNKRAVRVRSESRPISALYDIICKEKGLDVGDTTTTNDEDDSPAPAPEHSNKYQAPTNLNDTLATFWPLHHSYTSPMSSSLGSPNQRQLAKKKQRQAGRALTKDDGSVHALHSSQKHTNLLALQTSSAKSASLPPDETLANYYLKTEQQAEPIAVREVQRCSKSQEPTARAGGYKDTHKPFNTSKLYVEPPNVPMSELQRQLASHKAAEQHDNGLDNDDDDDEDYDIDSYDPDQVLNTLARWQQELAQANEPLLNGANGHHSQSPPTHPANHHQSPLQSQSHHATNARRFITRTPRSSSRQSAGHSSPPPPATAAAGIVALPGHYHSDTSSSPSPTRQRALSPYLGNAQHSSANGNSSAYETAATSVVMTHAAEQRRQQQPQQFVAVPKAITETSQSLDSDQKGVVTTSSVIIRPDKKKGEEQQQQQRQRYSSPSSPRQPTISPIARRLSSSELSPKSLSGGFVSEPVAASTAGRLQPRSASQPVDTPPSQRRLVPTATVSIKQNLSEMHFRGCPANAAVSPSRSPQKSSAECTVRMRPRSSTMFKENELEPQREQQRDNLTNLQLSPVQKQRTQRTPESSPRRNGDRDKSAKRKSNLNRALNEEATQDGDDALASRRRRRRELGMARPLVPGEDEALRDLLQSPQKSSCSESTNSKSEPSRSSKTTSSSNKASYILVPPLLHPEVPVRTMTAVLPAPAAVPLRTSNPVQRICRRSDTLPLNSLRKQRTEDVNQKFNERTKTDLAEIIKIAEQANAAGLEAAVAPRMSPVLRRKSADELQQSVPNVAQSSPPAQNQIVSILKKKHEHAFGECHSSASSNASPVTFSANVLDTPIKHKRQGILKKRSSLDESRYYSRSHSPDERSILIKSARRNSLEESGSAANPAQVQLQQQQQQHGILKQSSYDSNKSDGCPSATECQPQSILKKKDSLSTPSDSATHISKHVSISQAVTLAAAELGRTSHDVEHMADDMYATPNNEDYDIKPILKQESTSSEEAPRPPKPILKKKSFGEADEQEIRPILKTSRKSSREEFDESGVLPENAEVSGENSVRPILKTDSPSKRRSLGHESGTSSPSLLKRRTRSLERQDAPAVVDLAAALHAISSNQSLRNELTDAAAPVDFVTVAERIKHMELLASPTTPAGANSSWDSPLQQSISMESGKATAQQRVLKPSVLRRDLYRERYKTQPVTSEEKSFFKANSTPFDISASSAFRPTKPLDIRASQLQQQTQQPLISPITGQPLSHVPAPLLLSSSTLSGSVGNFKLARSSTQPLQSPRVVSLAQGTPPSRQPSLNDSVNLSEQLTLSLGSESEHIFEMSGLDEDSAIQSLGGEDASAATTASTTQSSGVGVGVARSNSVRARASMFQQLQEQTRTRRESNGAEQSTSQPRNAAVAAAVNRQANYRHSSPPISNAAAHSPPLNDESSTLNVTQDADEDFEPSSLSLAERLAFFSSLCESSAGGGGSANGRFRSRTSSYSRSSPPYTSMDRYSSVNSYNSNSCGLPATPRSSTTESSASVTPTPMECSPIISEAVAERTLETTAEMDITGAEKAPVQTLTNGFHQLSRSATEPTAVNLNLDAQTPPTTRRIRLRTVGKLIMPETFISDRNNNNKRQSLRLQTLEDIQLPLVARKIGKIKSPFIEQQQQQLQKERQHTPTESKTLRFDYKNCNGTGTGTGKTHNSASDCSDDANASDSGKENYAANQQAAVYQAPVVQEMRRKLTRLVNGSGQQQQQQQQQQQPKEQTPTVNRRHTTQIAVSTINVNGSCPKRASCHVDQRFAKYFGVGDTVKQTADNAEAHNEHVRLPATNVATTVVVQRRRELLKRTRAMSLEINGTGSISPTSMPSPKRSHSPAMLPSKEPQVANFDDIVVTQEELRSAGPEFKRLCTEILGGSAYN